MLIKRKEAEYISFINGCKYRDENNGLRIKRIMDSNEKIQYYKLNNNHHGSGIFMIKINLWIHIDFFANIRHGMYKEYQNGKLIRYFHFNMSNFTEIAKNCCRIL